MRSVMAAVLLALVAEGVLHAARPALYRHHKRAPQACVMYRNIDRSDTAMFVVKCSKPLPDTVRIITDRVK